MHKVGIAMPHSYSKMLIKLKLFRKSISKIMHRQHVFCSNMTTLFDDDLFLLHLLF